ncbi:MATE family efflux transporter [Plectonema radiosum NIES-515]|uniref:Probable multidrug resistance protein NorM n=1 Tax=Plectonema radiosum NIES-515 TaxID=2986073 RepID=A0ABT3B6Y7_9CYAN|nr:guanitoxin biosynthesis MATE family efflux transporter GntT [Plectonema radiosum]MCV3216970.1 MATE family efflux transporter [Plectonema radiosum NIES-515]
MNLTLPRQSEFLGRFFRITVANVLSTVIVPVAQLLGVAFLGHLPEIQHLTGVALAGSLLACLYEMFLFLRMGVTGLTAMALGQDDQEAVLLVGLRHGFIALVAGVAMVLLQYPLRQLGFALLSSTPPDILASAGAYFDAQIWGSPAILINFVLLGWFSAREKNRIVVLMSFFGNAANVVLNYLLIIRWGWESTGAGVSYAISQYVTLLTGLFFLFLQIKWQEVRAVANQFWDFSAFKATFVLNINIFVSMIFILLVMLTFNYESAKMGTIIYAENSLLLQLLVLNSFIFEGLSMGVETLIGNFKGKGVKEQLLPLLGLALGTALLIGLSTSGVSVLFPQTIFGLFTNHSEVTENIDVYAPWLLLVLGFSSVSFVLGGYFLGITKTQILRNSNLIAALFGFAPAALAAFTLHSNHILWLALSLFHVMRLVVFVVQLPGTFKIDVGDGSSELNLSEEDRSLDAAA